MKFGLHNNYLPTYVFNFVNPSLLSNSFNSTLDSGDWASLLIWQVPYSSEYWRKDEKAEIVLPGKQLSFKVQINHFFGGFFWPFQVISGNTVVVFSSLRQYSLLPAYLAGSLSVSSVFLANVNIVAKFRFRTSDANDARYLNLQRSEHSSLPFRICQTQHFPGDL